MITDINPCYSCDDINSTCFGEFCKRRQNWRPRLSVAEMIQTATDRAKAKHPVFAPSLDCAVNILTEEYLELVTAYNDHRHVESNLPRVTNEVLDVAAVAVRLLEMLRECLTGPEWRLVEDKLRGTGQDDRVKV